MTRWERAVLVAIGLANLIAFLILVHFAVRLWRWLAALVADAWGQWQVAADVITAVLTAPFGWLVPFVALCVVFGAFGVWLDATLPDEIVPCAPSKPQAQARTPQPLITDRRLRAGFQRGREYGEPR